MEIVELVKVSTPSCMFCGKGGTVVVPKAGIEAYQAGAFIQDAFPRESADVREQIMTGTHPACWDEMLGPDEDVIVPMP